MASVAVNNDRLATNNGAIMVKGIDDEDKFDNEDKAKHTTAVQVPPQLPHVPFSAAAAMALRQGS